MNTPIFGSLTTDAFDIFNASTAITVNDVIKDLGGSFVVLGQHYFVTNPFTGSGVSPTFDFRAASKKGEADAFVIANKTGDLPAPTGSQDVDWLELTGAIGDLAKHVFRIDTKAGQAPSTVGFGSNINHRKIIQQISVHPRRFPLYQVHSPVL